MGVISCNRSNCPDVMCDTYVKDVGYICTECQDEFKEYLENKGLSNLTEHKIVELLKIFIETDKGTFLDNPVITIDDFFKQKTIR